KILPETAGEAAPLLDRQRYRFERAEMGKQRIDLERARQPAMHALLRLARGDVFLAEQDLSAVGREHAGDEIDQRGLAGAVRPDQRVARAFRQRDADVVGDDQRAEALVE